MARKPIGFLQEGHLARPVVGRGSVICIGLSFFAIAAILCSQRAGLGNRAAFFAGDFDPLVGDDLDVFERFFGGFTVGHATGQVLDFSEVGSVFVAPPDSHCVFVVHKL